MRNLILTLLLLSTPTLAESVLVEVVSIYDGDSITVNVPGWPDVVGHRIGVRAAGVDTPELGWRAKCQAEKELARKAKEFTVARVREAKEVRLANIRRDKYFRLLATVLIDGQRLDQMLIHAGLGIEYHGKGKPGWCTAEK